MNAMNSNITISRAIELNFLISESKINFSLSICLKKCSEYSGSVNQMNQLKNVLSGNAYDVLWYHIEKYYLHSLAIWSNTKSTKSLDVARAFDRCIEFQRWIQYSKNNLPGLIKNTINMKNHLTLILPHINNNSYLSSFSKLEMILNTAIYLKSTLTEIEKQSLQMG